MKPHNFLKPRPEFEGHAILDELEYVILEAMATAPGALSRIKTGRTESGKHITENHCVAGKAKQQAINEGRLDPMRLRGPVQGVSG